MRSARQLHTATTLADGSVLVAGGTPDVEGRGALDSAELFKGGAWQPAGTLIQARHGQTATSLGDRVLLTGGLDANGTPLSTAEVSTPGGGWDKAGDADVVRYDHAAARLNDGGVLVTGGDDLKRVLPIVQRWAFPTTLSAPGAPHSPTSRSGAPGRKFLRVTNTGGQP